MDRHRHGVAPTILAVVSDQYRMHRLRAGDEWVLGTLARGNARFGDGKEQEWLPPLGTEETAQFVSDPDTVCIVAIDLETNHIAGFVYGGVLKRRHTKLHHICLYEVGVDIDHRARGVGPLLLSAFAAPFLQVYVMGILATLVLIVVAAWEYKSLTRAPAGPTLH